MTTLFYMIAPVAARQSSIIGSALRSGVFARFILLILFIVSAASWAVIVYKFIVYKNAKIESKSFLLNFGKWKNNPAKLAGLCKKFKSSYIARIVHHGCLEQGSPGFTRSKLSADEMKGYMDNAISDEVMRLEELLVVLAIAASASPLLGLLGTVWGVMGAFLGMEAHQSATISAVAPGISDALITTIAGLAAAIPAVVAYNYFVNQVKIMTTEMENFANRFAAGFFEGSQ